tara:strand:- start:151 stop:492 length:342 start_codon:yes stop_codon:yes gene_type:complete
MNKGIVFLGIILAFLLTSCASHSPAVPKHFKGSSKLFEVSSNGTVKVKISNLIDQPMHWIFVRCEHWSGCYMQCQGPLMTCKRIAKKSGLKISHILTSEMNKYNWPIPRLVIK